MSRIRSTGRTAAGRPAPGSAPRRTERPAGGSRASAPARPNADPSADPAARPDAGATARPPASSGLAWLWKVLVVHSVKDLVRYKSFLLLVAVLIVADRAFQHYVRPEQAAFQVPPLAEWGSAGAAWLFEAGPRALLDLVKDGRAVAVLAGLFALKELISLWPSSDMRRMHRQERGRSGFVGALAALRWRQVLWDATASALLAGIGGAWVLVAYLPARALWQATGWAGWLALLLVPAALAAPAIFAGLSYSSKLAVMARGRFGEKLRLFLRLFSDWDLLWKSWVFCVLRMTVEALFALIVPLTAFATIENYVLRIAVAALFAAPAYSYAKMAGFKFFLVMYERFPLVQEEFRGYYGVYRL